MRKQDVLIFLLCAAGLFFVLQQEGTMTLQKGFSILHNAPHSLADAVEHELSEHDIVNLGDSNTMSQYQEYGPKPIVTDLDGDGYNELIVFQKADDNSGPSVKILSFKQLLNRPPLQGNDKFVQLSTKKRLVFKTASRGRIVGMATGYLTPNDREQKLVVVFANWKVLMFDHELKLMWESKIVSELDRDDLLRIRSPKEVVVAISPYRIHIDDKGIVVIGLRQFNFKQHSHTDSKANGPEDQSEVSHYSYYAFDGLTGVQRWKHESKDFQFANEEETVYPQHNYKIDAKQHTQHSGEVHWRTYKEDILRNMPHLFRHPQDTQIELDHFIPSHKRKQQSKTDSSEYGDLGSRLFENLKYLKKPAVVTPTTAIPNVVVSHLSKGMEVIHIYTGRTLCQVAPLKSRASYADLNSDGVIDTAEARKADPNAGECVGVIESGSQAEVLFQAPICENTQGLAQFSVFRVKEEDPEALKHVTAVPPAIMTKSDANQAKVQRDVAFFVSTGLVTDVYYDFAYGEWRVRWQTLTPSKFGVSNEKKNKEGDVDKDKEVEDISYSEIRQFALRKYEPDSFLIAVGDNYLSVLDSYGTVQSVIELPQSSSSPLIFADINNDKINDIIVTTNEGYYGYVTKTHSGNSVLTSLVICVTAIVVLLYLSSSIEIKDESFQKNPSLKQQ